MLKNEDKILLIIRYAPLFFLLFIAITINIFLIQQKKEIFLNEKERIEKNYIQVNKEVAKQEILELTHYINTRQNDVEVKLKQNLKEGVLNAYKIIDAIYEEHKEESPERIKERVVKILNNVRFNQNRSYIIIFETTGKNILHPLKEKVQGKNSFDFQDANGVYILREVNKLLKNKNETFISWYWYKKDKKAHKKIGFVKKFEKLGLYVGAGDFVSDYEDEVKKEVVFYIKNIKLKDNKYVFVLNFDGEYINHFDDIYIGKNIANTNLLPNNEVFFSQIKKTSKGNGGFVQYPYIKPANNKILKKTSYVISNEKWSWIIGTGFYMDDFKKEVDLKKEQLDTDYALQKENLFIIMIIFTLILLILSIIISKLLEKKFLSYKKQIEEQLKENIKKDNLLAYQSKMAAMGEMIGNIAHQWRQPLSIISTAASGIKIQRELGILTKELETQELDSIGNNVKYLSKTIDDFRNFLKPNKNVSVFKIDELIDKTLKLVGAQYENKNIKIIKDVDNISIIARENELLQVLINILNNARDELLKLNKKRYIFICVKEKEENLIIKIRDNATGIEEKILPKIFDSYFTTKEDDKGTGIGLFMSKEIIEKHLGGTLEAFNVEYKYKEENCKGAEFKIKIPLGNKKL